MKKAAFLFLLCACGNGNGEGQVSMSLIRQGCGPAGGAAYTLVANAPGTCTSSPTGTRDEISVYGSMPSSPSTVEVTSGKGTARNCTGTTCSDAQSATITFTSISATEARGTYVITTSSGMRTGSFEAPRCSDAKMLCF